MNHFQSFTEYHMVDLRFRITLRSARSTSLQSHCQMSSTYHYLAPHRQLCDEGYNHFPCPVLPDTCMFQTVHNMRSRSTTVITPRVTPSSKIYYSLSHAFIWSLLINSIQEDPNLLGHLRFQRALMNTHAGDTTMEMTFLVLTN